MTYDLLIGDYAYSSWSLRGWLLFERFGISRRVERVAFSEGSVTEQAPGWAPVRLVPAMRTPDGVLVGDSLAMAEELASRHPKAGLWPEDPKARAVARYLAAEMHSGFAALRTDCPMNMRLAYSGVEPRAEVEADLRRLEQLWEYAREACQPAGPWLCGAYSVADAFYAPVAARIAGYGLDVSPSAQAYVAAHLADGAFRRWRAMGLVHGATLKRYAMPYEVVDWPGPAPLSAKAVAAGPSVNEACPYSGDPVLDFLEMDGKVYGFCNPFCRDKTMVDPEAWPAFMALVEG